MVDMGLYARNLDDDKLTSLQTYQRNIIAELEDRDRVNLTLINHRERHGENVYAGRQATIDPRPVLGERDLNRMDFDVIHFNCHLTYRFPALIDTPVVVTYHGDEWWEIPGKDNFSMRWDYLRRLPDLGLVPQYDRFVFASDDLRERCERRYSPIRLDAETIPHGVDHEVYRPTPDGEVLERYDIEKPYVFHVSNFTPRKNPRRFLRAVKSVQDRFDVQLVIAGGRWTDNERLDSLLDEVEFHDVILTGYVPEGDLPALYSNAEAFLLPSLHECFGMPLLEAMACETPVVTSDRYSMPEVADGAAELCDPTSVDSIATALEAVLADEEKRDRMRTDGRAVADRFSWERTAAELADVYREYV